MGMVMRVQVLPGGIVVGHIVPLEHPANGVNEMKENHVYELRTEHYFGTNSFHDIGIADFVNDKNFSIDRFLALSGGKHLTVKDGK